MSDLERLASKLSDLEEGVRPDEGAIEDLLCCALELIAVARLASHPDFTSNCVLCTQTNSHYEGCPLPALHKKLAELF